MRDKIIHSEPLISEPNPEKVKEFSSFALYNKSVEDTKQALLHDLYTYSQVYENDQQGFYDKLRMYGVKVENLDRLKRLRGRVMDKEFTGLFIASHVDLGNGPQKEVLGAHETIHKLQADDNSPIPKVLNDLKAIVGFIVLAVKILPKILIMKQSRKKYGIKEASEYAAKSNELEWETLMYDNDITYLDRRKPFAYKIYGTKEGRSRAIERSMSIDINKRLNIVAQQINILETTKSPTESGIKILNAIIDELLDEVQKIQKIRREYADSDWELLDFQHPQYGWQVWAESEKNKDKRHSIIRNYLAKEKALIKIIKRNENIIILSSQGEIEQGVIKIQAKDSDNWRLSKQLQDDPEIKKLNPLIYIDALKRDEFRNPAVGDTGCIRITFVK